MKILFSILILLFSFIGDCLADTYPHSECQTLASVFNNGKGDSRTKKQGGNYAAIKLDSLQNGQTLQINPISGNLKYVTLHARYQGGYWRTIYKGAETKFPIAQYLADYRKDKKCTHVNISVNGAHEKYEPIACKAEILLCTPPGKAPCSTLGKVYNDGTGDNRTKKRGGNYAAFKMESLQNDQILRINPVSGNLKYVTLHARYQGGYWRTIYKGAETQFPIAQYLADYRKDKKCTHVNISVNGAHEKYEPIACKAEILLCPPPGKAPCSTLGKVYNDGTGDNRTKKRGGNYAAFKMESLQNDQVLRINPVSGNLKYVTLHARYQGGYWRTIYKGAETQFPIAQYLADYRKDKKCTHVNISVNGAHEKYEPIACKAEILLCTPPGKAPCSTLGKVYNDGTGDNRTKKRGGNYAAFKMESLQNDQVLRINPVSGNLKYVTLHARYQGGYWRTIYKGAETKFPVKKYLADYRKDKNCTHVIVSVNGGHEKYEPIACKADIMLCD